MGHPWRMPLVASHHRLRPGDVEAPVELLVHAHAVPGSMPSSNANTTA